MRFRRKYIVEVEAEYELSWDNFKSMLISWAKEHSFNGVVVKIKNTTK